jgi:septum site-determining protein MinC
MSQHVNPVQFKGQKDGLWILMSEDIPAEDLFDALEHKLASSNNFFTGAEVTIHAGARTFSPDERAQLATILETRYGLHIIKVEEAISPSIPKTDLDRPQTDTQTEDGLAVQGALHDVNDDIMKALDETFWIPVRQRRHELEPDTQESFYEGEDSTLYFRGTVRSGQSLEFPGNIVILGDVNPGAYVIASGDIIVMGRLNGVVHAGAEGEERAVVIGAGFFPSQLRIAQYIGRPPDEQPQRKKGRQVQTEKASIKDGGIVIEPVV